MDKRDRIAYGQKLLQFMQKDQGYHLSFDGVIKPKQDQPQKILGFPWVFSGEDGGKMICPLWQTLYWNVFQIIPSHCISSCWKVVIIPNSVKELFEANQFLDDYNLTSKTGLDMRPYTFGMYKAFIYCDNEKTAGTYEKHAKGELTGCRIFKKKGCTEFENKARSDTWEPGQYQHLFEKALQQDVDHGYFGFGKERLEKFYQPPWGKDIIKLHWAQSAYASGDPNWKHTPYSEFVVTSKNPVIY